MAIAGQMVFGVARCVAITMPKVSIFIAPLLMPEPAMALASVCIQLPFRCAAYSLLFRMTLSYTAA